MRFMANAARNLGAKAEFWRCLVAPMEYCLDRGCGVKSGIPLNCGESPAI